MVAAAIADWAAATPLIDGVLFGSSDGEVAGPPVCAVAVAGNFRGYGKGLTHSQALASAVGEALELFSASRIDPRRLVQAPFAELGAAAFDPAWLCLYSEEQYGRRGFPFQPFDPHRPLHWIEGRWLDNNQPVYLPAFAIALSDQFAGEALCQVTSNGLAAGESPAAAVEHAVLELYERDAFLLSWLALLPKRKVAAHSIPPDSASLISHLASRGARTEVYLLAQDQAAVVAVAVAIGDGIEWPAFTLGLGAARNRSRAIGKALLELGQTGPFLARVWRRRESPLPIAPQDIKTLQDHALYYCTSSHRGEFARWRATPNGLPTAAFTDVRIAAVDLTPPELQISPFRVVRALARGLQTVSCGYGFQRLPCARLAALLAGNPPNPSPCPIC